MKADASRLSRRDVLKFFAAASATLATGKFAAFAQPAAVPAPPAKGYGTDPNLLKLYSPGDAWPLTFTPEQRSAAAALADVIFPADDLGPAASALRVPDYVDEWISSPYPDQQHDHTSILEGLAWLETESQKRFQKSFANLAAEQQRAICDDICSTENAKPEFKTGANFFGHFRTLCAAAYYATPEGWKAIGYVGNVPLTSFDGPPPEVLKQLGVEQTVN